MPQPKKRMTSTRTGNRRSHDRLKEVTLITCKKCKSPVLAHKVCDVCGYYNDKQVIDVNKKEKKTSETSQEAVSK